MSHPGMFEEQQGGHCNWCRVSEGRILGEEAMRGQIVKGFAGRVRAFGFYTQGNEELW